MTLIPKDTPEFHARIDISTIQNRIEEVLQEKIPIQRAIVHTELGVDVLPANILLAEAEIPISGMHGREVLLRRAIAPASEDYDFIICDCPPNVGILSVNALMASNYVLIPVDMSYLGLLGIPVIERMLNLIQTRLEHPLEILGILATRHDIRLNISKDALDSLKERFGDTLFQTIIPETVKIREAPSYQKSIFDHAPQNAGAKAYKKFITEVISRVQTK